MKISEYFDFPSVEAVSSFHLEEGEFYITAGGFEDRTLAFSKVAENPYKTKAIILNYQPFDERNKIIKLKNRLRDIGFQKEDIINITYDRMSPVGFADELIEKIEKYSIKKVVLDISSMSKLAILLCLDVCREKCISVRVFYAEAKVYKPSKEAFTKAQKDETLKRPSMNVYSGIEDIFQVNRFSSVAMQGYPPAIISFMSLNEKFIQILLNRLSPSKLYLINGIPPRHSWREEATAWLHDRLCKEWERNNPISEDTGLPNLSSSTLQYSETVNLLSELYWKVSSSCRVILAPTGSKLQTVACLIFRSAHTDIHIEYPTAQGFLEEFSSGIGNTWLINLGDLQKLIDDYSRYDLMKNLLIKI